ncbi:toll/interleukin-1 receptor domain-containing protein [uncultured Sphingomonas sp.]|uniref:toll/interleukin-1 receptor domain-containing protein n=1 Tax=uncultured Sphingomonas sp. TaxID=158754 RepID=UPI0025FA242D|nr:toll/interleukin-1 receptor domain-containing protein [uncultured Sphingomonas sp.]
MKCFISHSSKDKASYASIVADKLKPNIEYDELTFEGGMKNLDEILNALDRSSLFALLISDNSLNSEWVKREITEAEQRLEIGQLKRFFPIIIDRNINHTDPRIPSWVREAYNLRPITRPTIAAKRIRERMIEASWQSHPMLKARDQIFVGRNTQIHEFEQRFDDFTKSQPKALLASGLHEIGRKTTIKNALRKANIVRDTYDPIKVNLTRDDSIEGFILKLYDLGISESIDVGSLLSRSIEEKVSICCSLISDIVKHQEILMIDDNYAIVRFEGEVAPWFQSVIEKLPHEKLAVCVASSARAKKHLYIRDDNYFFIHIPELEKSERIGLFKRYAELMDLELSIDDYKNFAPLLKGFPEQVTYAASLIQDLGTDKAFKNSHDIANFSTFRASISINKISDNTDLLDFLRFISSFEFVSIDFISIIGYKIGRDITDNIDLLMLHNICESIGPSGNYFRVNEVIRDAIIRDRVSITDFYSKALRAFAEDFAKSSDASDFDVSEYQIAIREALSSGIDIPDKLLIPAHFLQTMRQLYDNRHYKEVISLADRILISKENFDDHTEQDIRYYLCQSLARLSDNRFLDEVQSINGPEHDFLLGFYYRIKRRFPDALTRYKRAMEHRRTEQRARREIVFVLITIEDFNGAISLARENFEQYQRNPFLAQAYFSCLIHHSDRLYAMEESKIVLQALEKIGGARATEMLKNLGARFEFEFGDKTLAFSKINLAISQYPDVIYPLLTKLEMAMAIQDLEIIKDTVSKLKRINLSSGHKLAISKAEAVLAALSGDKDRADRMINRELSDLTQSAKDRLKLLFQRH